MARTQHDASSGSSVDLAKAFLELSKLLPGASMDGITAARDFLDVVDSSTSEAQVQVTPPDAAGSAPKSPQEFLAPDFSVPSGSPRPGLPTPTSILPVPATEPPTPALPPASPPAVPAAEPPTPAPPPASPPTVPATEPPTPALPQASPPAVPVTEPSTPALPSASPPAVPATERPTPALPPVPSAVPGTKPSTPAPPPASPPAISSAEPPTPALPPASPRVAPAAEPPTPTLLSVPATLLDLLQRQGDTALRSGDVSAARRFYERGANAGCGACAEALAQTYDADQLRRMGTVGIKADPAQVEAWRARARQLGQTKPHQ